MHTSYTLQQIEKRQLSMVKKIHSKEMKFMEYFNCYIFVKSKYKFSVHYIGYCCGFLAYLQLQCQFSGIYTSVLTKLH